MIKGVNKRIIEINNPESIYFEKAIFYLKPSVRELPAAVTEAEIKKYICRLGLEEYGVRRQGRAKKIIFLLAAVALVAGIALAFIL